MKYTALLLPFALACVTPVSPPIAFASSPDKDAAWAEEVKLHTTSNEAYHYASLEADLRATLVTPRLRAAFVKARANFHGKPSRDFEKLLLQLDQPADPPRGDDLPEPKGAEQQVVIFASLYVRNLVHRSLDANYSEWDVTLSRGDATVRPVEIDVLRFTPAIKALLPHTDRFDEIYILRFPLVEAESGKVLLAGGKDPVELRIASAMADVSVAWRLEGQGGAR